MRKVVAISFSIVLLISCVPRPAEDPGFVMVGTVISGETLGPVCLLSLDGGELSSDWEARAELNGQNLPMEKNGDCFFSPPASEVPQAGDLLSLDIQLPPIRLRSSIRVPPSPSNATLTNNVFSVQTNVVQPVADLQWEAPEGLSFLLKLESLSSEALSIPFEGVQGGNFEKELGNLILQKSVALVNTDFSHYGLHRITIFSFFSETAEVIAYLPQFNGGIITAPPTNINEGSGYLMAVGKAEVFLEIIP